jgi:hypothetical protein
MTSDSNSKSDSESKQLRIDKARERLSITLFRKPFKTLYYFSLVLFDAAKFPINWTLNPANRISVVLSFLVFVILAALREIEGAHTPAFNIAEHYFLYFLWWFGLGVASSIGHLNLYMTDN